MIRIGRARGKLSFEKSSPGTPFKELAEKSRELLYVGVLLAVFGGGTADGAAEGGAELGSGGKAGFGGYRLDGESGPSEKALGDAYSFGYDSLM